MFPLTLQVHGKHAYYMRFLRPDEHSERLFARHIDIYMNAAILGFLFGRKEDKDTEGEFKDITPVSIFAETVQREQDNLDFIFRLIMLLDSEGRLSDEDRINRAFRDDVNRERNEKHGENFKVFEQYVRGGISLLYEKISENATKKDEYIDNIMEFMESFNEEITGRIYDEVAIEPSIL